MTCMYIHIKYLLSICNLLINLVVSVGHHEVTIQYSTLSNHFIRFDIKIGHLCLSSIKTDKRAQSYTHTPSAEYTIAVSQSGQRVYSQLASQYGHQLLNPPVTSLQTTACPPG